ncbi:unnamed protein product [Vitrella brassicaformis CCMP3155]|uniref:Uncharacterized protein n=1 Tax=Vitrella brassicaformis (strain CCMP3155) TaxID=1169540 RepID=A0A0G4EJE3_VITBC|nr:unnamed protein product [Vitrella brassicaformis CCMP3155]|mmetsp:Transcript_25579/g.63365  ORF Transcript_25579/g.63365 Transcript_25579/m.63365 type:complete len:89 (+) Transcript_25579:127-393(+)|eukprot:CEL96605.1 unnamed protein product [Vitrella brassicaformis CCMP3155]
MGYKGYKWLAPILGPAEGFISLFGKFILFAPGALFIIGYALSWKISPETTWIHDMRARTERNVDKYAHLTDQWKDHNEKVYRWRQVDE